MTDAAALDDDLPEVPAAVADSILSWSAVIRGARSENVADILSNAAADLFRTRRISKTMWPESDGIVNQAIVDALADMAQAAGIEPDDAQLIFAQAQHDDAAERSNGHGIEEPPAFPLIPFDGIHVDTTRRGYLVKGLLASTGLAVIWGPPKCGKSFWATDIGLHIALGWEYRGRKVQQATCIYIALEGRHGFPARIEAFRKYHGIESAPFYLITTSLDLIANADALVASIKAQLGTALPGIVFIDTLNRSLVGSESKDEDMGRYLSAAEKVEQELGCAVAIVHHSGIDASRPRGHTSLSGSVESQLACKRGDTGEVIVTVELAKDFAEGVEIFSRLETVELGVDPDGDAITSLIVLPAETPLSSTAEPRLSKNQQTLFSILHDAGAAGLVLEEWNSRARDAGIGVKRKADLYDIRSNLLSKGLIRRSGDRWVVTT